MSILLLLAVAAALPDTAAFDAVLRRNVRDDGQVRYAELHAAIAPLDAFVQQLAAASPDSHPKLFPTREARLAYWINAYNALVLHAFASDYPKDKDRLRGLAGRASFFYRRKFTVGGQARSLDDIETRSIRAMGDPRIHFAIVCASGGCPWLGREAFTPGNLDQQLEARARLFVSQSRNVRPDPAQRTLWLSRIFEWYRGDFGGDVLPFLRKYRTDLAGEWTLRYLEYDWSLNDVR